MSPLNSLMNRAATLAESKPFINHAILPRMIMPCGGIPLEIALVVLNTVKLPIVTAGFCIKIPTKIFSTIIPSKTLKEFDNSLPGPSKMLETSLRIICCSIGILANATLGIINPITNFRFHCSLGLIKDNKIEAEKIRLAKEREEQIQKHEKQIINYITSLVDSIREKNKSEEEKYHAQWQPLSDEPLSIDPPTQLKDTQSSAIISSPSMLTEIHQTLIPTDRSPAKTPFIYTTPSICLTPKSTSPLEPEEIVRSPKVEIRADKSESPSFFQNTESPKDDILDQM